MRKVVRGAIALVSAAMIMAVTASSAFATGNYNNGGVAGEQTGGGGNLPFTGADLALYVVVGVAIIASGFALRALSARRSIS
jgi:hypothetical protein